MSRAALAVAVRDHIRANWTVLGFTGSATDGCGLTPPGGMPPPVAGDWYVGVCAAGGSSDRVSRGQALGQVHAVDVVISWRCRQPFDRVGAAVHASGGLFDRVERIIRLVGRDAYDHVICRLANTALGDPGNGNEPVGYRRPLCYLEDDGGREVNAEWWGAEPGRSRAPVGYALTIRFGDAMRPTNLANVPLES